MDVERIAADADVTAPSSGGRHPKTRGDIAGANVVIA
jgi:hypothetical protein